MSVTGTILLSRQPLRPCGRDDWVKNTLKAIGWLKERDLALYSSTGILTWELITSLGAVHKLPLRIFIPCDTSQDFEAAQAETIRQFDLVDIDVRLLPVFPDNSQTDKRSLWERRDRLIVNHCGIILPVSVRAGGYLDSLVNSARREGRTIIDEFMLPYRRRRTRLTYRIDPVAVNPDLRKLTGRYLFHWTRAANTAWPTERLIDFYQAIVASETYPRSAFHTLLNIVNTGRLVASGKNMPDATPVVSFSEQAPAEMTELFRWRARYRQMSFEPYGIAIERKTATELGIRPVRYYDRAEDGDSGKRTDDERWLSQSRGVKSDWIAEEEYRHHGDLDISGIRKDRLILICGTADEADSLAEQTGLETLPFAVD